VPSLFHGVESVGSPRVPSDLSLDQSDWSALQAGDEGGLGRLIDRWQRPLFHFAYRYLQNSADASDVVSEVFVVLYRKRLRLSEQIALSPWLFTVTANRCRNHLRWRRRHPAEAWDTAAEESAGIAAELSPDQALLRREAQQKIAAAIDRLPHDLKVALLLHHYEGLSYREIAEVVGCGERGVETRLYRARQQLKLLLNY